MSSLSGLSCNVMLNCDDLLKVVDFLFLLGHAALAARSGWFLRDNAAAGEEFGVRLFDVVVQVGVVPVAHVVALFDRLGQGDGSDGLVDGRGERLEVEVELGLHGAHAGKGLRAGVLADHGLSLHLQARKLLEGLNLNRVRRSVSMDLILVRPSNVFSLDIGFELVGSEPVFGDLFALVPHAHLVVVRVLVAGAARNAARDAVGMPRRVARISTVEHLRRRLLTNRARQVWRELAITTTR